MIRLAALVVTVALLGWGCERGNAAAEESAVAFDTTRVRLATASDTITLVVELAISEEQKTVGLMERRSLPADAGMLFLYREQQPASGGFWMFRTRIPLDIAFLDSTGVIHAIVAMEPCASPFASGCPAYEAGVPYHGALEVNRGFFARRGIERGDRLLLEELPGRD
jgi:uncharacterized protein